MIMCWTLEESIRGMVLSDCFLVAVGYLFRTNRLHFSDRLFEKFSHNPSAQGREGRSPQCRL